MCLDLYAVKKECKNQSNSQNPNREFTTTEILVNYVPTYPSITFLFLVSDSSNIVCQLIF